MTNRKPSPAVQLALSLLILFHMAAIIAAVTGTGSGSFAPPPVVAELRALVSPYLQFLFLSSPYRFFAPNPGVDPSLWVRIKFENGETRCLEWPHFRDRNLPSAYTRDFGIPRRISSLTAGEPGKPLTLTPTAGILCSAAVRRICTSVVPETFSVELDRGELGAVKHIDIYSLHRKLPSPAEVRQGMDHLDLRLYQALYLGRFLPSGERVNEPAVQTIELDSLVSTAIDRDIRSTRSSATRLYGKRWPSQIDSLLKAKPELYSLPTEELRAEIKTLIPPSNVVTNSTIDFPPTRIE